MGSTFRGDGRLTRRWEIPTTDRVITQKSAVLIFSFSHATNLYPSLVAVMTEDTSTLHLHNVKQSLYRPVQPLGHQEVEDAIFLNNWHTKAVSLSALGIGRLYWFSVVLQSDSTHAHSTARKISPWNRNDPFGNRKRVLPACRPVPQPTAPPRTPICLMCITQTGVHNYSEFWNIKVDQWS